MTDKRVKVLAAPEYRSGNTLAVYVLCKDPQQTFLLQNFDTDEGKEKFKQGEFLLIKNVSIVHSRLGQYMKMSRRSRVSISLRM